MPIKAEISGFRTRPYEPGELAEMEQRERERTKVSGYEKVLAEEVLEEIAAENLDLLRYRVSEIAEACKPSPLIVKIPEGDADPHIKHSFLINRAYLSDDPDGILETIIYCPKDPESYQEKMKKAAQEFEAKRATPTEQEEFMKRAVKSIFEESARTFASSYEKTLKQLGFANNDEFRGFCVNLESKRSSFATEEEFQNFSRAEWDRKIKPARARRRAELVSMPPYWAGRLPSVLNNEMTVLCRIIGKNNDQVYRYQHYYRKFHNISGPAFSVDNEADDGLTVSFVYGMERAT